MLPLSIIIAILAMTLGVGGALFFSPVFIIIFPLLGVTTLTPATAFGAALVTEVFGFTSGLIGYSKKKLIDTKTATGLMVFTIPAAILGTILKRFLEKTFNPEFLNIIFGFFLLLLAIYVYRSIKSHAKEGIATPLVNDPKRRIVDVDNNVYEYQVCNQIQEKILTGSGGLLTGLISVGVGETVVSTLRVKCGLPMKVATATSVLVVTLTVFVAAIFDIIYVMVIDGADIANAVPWTLVLFTIPGVLIGGQIGPRISSKINSSTSEKLLILIFLIFGVIMLVKGFIS